MTTDRLFELPDGSTLVVALDRASPAVLDELETWSLVAGQEEPAEIVRDPSVWTNLVSAGPLVVATVQGMIGNAAWSVFPAAAHWLGDRRERRHVLDAAAAASRASAAVSSVAGVAESAVQVTETARDSTGGWRVQAQIDSGRRATALLDATGLCVSVRLRNS
jgi:hypothetical protein